MRHATAKGFADSDHERDLEPSGHRDASMAGTWLAEVGIRPDAALVSSARRTTTTWEELSASLGHEVRVNHSSALYAAEPDSALDLIRETSPEVHTLVVVGHNPTVAYLAQLLDDGEGDADAVSGMITGFPTCAMAVFAVAGEWSDLTMGALRLTRFHVPRAD